MIQVVVLGSGNLASHLTKALIQSDKIELKQVYGRTKESLQAIDNQIDKISDLKLLAEADIYIIAISDDHIASFSETLPLKDKFVVHTSGSVPYSALSTHNRRGVCYPLQSFTKDTDLNFTEIPICIEAENNEDLLLLERLASSLSKEVYFIDSDQRKKLHLAAVFVNNFVNHLYHIGHEICSQEVLPFEILKPLIAETARKIQDMSPKEAQTGPARRNDLKTIHEHQELLSQEQKALYQLLTNSIQATHGKEL